MVDHQQIGRVWDLLQRDREGIEPRPLLHWFAVGPGDRAGDFASTPGELAQAAQTCQAMGMNFYLQLNPSSNRLRMRARSEDVTHWMYLLMDVDPIDPGADPERALESYIGMSLIERTTPHIIDSGRGMQAWFPFRPMPVANRIEGSIPEAHAWWIRQFPKMYGCVLDPAVADLPRVMRCPGTTNVKTGKMARVVQEGWYPIRDSLGVQVLGTAPAFVPRLKPTPMPGRTWQTYIPHMTFGGMLFLGQGASRGSRHNDAVKAVKSLFELGCEEGQAREAVRWGSQLSEGPIDEEEIEQIVRSVYRRSVL